VVAKRKGSSGRFGNAVFRVRLKQKPQTGWTLIGEEESMLVFVPDSRTGDGSWEMVPLTTAVGIGLEDGRPVVRALDEGTSVVLLVPVTTAEGKEQCLLMSPSVGAAEVRVNGLPVLTLSLLTHRDEVRVGSHPLARIYLSSESKLEVVPFKEPKGSEKPTFCARSKARITEGSPAVRCVCGLWYLQTPEIPAFTYAPGATCVGCGRPTTLDFTWHPDPMDTFGKVNFSKYTAKGLASDRRGAGASRESSMNNARHQGGRSVQCQ
jgi:hypothetical protein